MSQGRRILKPSPHLAQTGLVQGSRKDLFYTAVQYDNEDKVLKVRKTN